MRILIIDDNDELRNIIRRMLENEKHDVFDAENGIGGLKIIQNEPHIDLVITDLIMPEKEGLETIREIHKDFPEIKIIAMSGGGKIDAQSYLPIAKGMGANVTLSKPFSRKDLLDVINKLT